MEQACNIAREVRVCNPGNAEAKFSLDVIRGESLVGWVYVAATFEFTWGFGNGLGNQIRVTNCHSKHPACRYILVWSVLNRREARRASPILQWTIGSGHLLLGCAATDWRLALLHATI